MKAQDIETPDRVRPGTSKPPGAGGTLPGIIIMVIGGLLAAVGLGA